jgi:ectoine hydroxylase-related dioxygenase (phytanoyl-CoA dioxygenase family)
MHASLSEIDRDYPLTDEQIRAYRADGFIKLDRVFSGETLARFRDAVATAVEQERSGGITPEHGRDEAREARAAYERLFIQKVNLWRRHEAVRPFVLSRRLGNLAARLSGRAMRLWHDHALFKEPHTGVRTPWHQDAPYWPHEERAHQLSAWIALKDATITNGCMSFIPQSHKLGPLAAVNLAEPKDLAEIAPQLKGVKPVTHELAAGVGHVSQRADVPLRGAEQVRCDARGDRDHLHAGGDAV